MKNLKSGFTLAEVLITLSIIGIVASMTIPTLINKQKEAATQTAVKKAYTTLSNAFNMAKAEYGPPVNWQLSDIKNIINTITPYLKVIKNCQGISGDCFPTGKYKTASNLEGLDIESNFVVPRVQLADGMLLGMDNSWNPKCDGDYGDGPLLESVCGVYFVDINGKKLPNRLGEDLFAFYLTNNGVFPIGSSKERIHHTFPAQCSRSSSNTVARNGFACTAWLIYKGNMDYLKCSENLSWSGQTTCN